MWPTRKRRGCGRARSRWPAVGRRRCDASESPCNFQRFLTEARAFPLRGSTTCSGRSCARPLLARQSDLDKFDRRAHEFLLYGHAFNVPVMPVADLGHTGDRSSYGTTKTIFVPGRNGPPRVPVRRSATGTVGTTGHDDDRVIVASAGLVACTGVRACDLTDSCPAICLIHAMRTV